jgi:hypothetical protein
MDIGPDSVLVRWLYTFTEATMRRLALALGVVVGVAGLAQDAAAQNYPWCAIYDVGDAAYNCGFVTFEQCRASVSGIGGTCMRNTTYNPAAIPRAHSQNR